MEQLDFSLLDNITNIGTPKEIKTKAIMYLQDENSLQDPTDIGKARVEIERQQDILKRARSAWSAWSAAIKKSELYRSNMMKLAKSGASNKELLLLALDCIYSITGDKVFYNQLTQIVKHNK